MADTDEGVARYPYLLDDKLSAEHKTLLLQADLERDKERRSLPQAREAASFERLKFWSNTPLVVALVGMITVGANFAASYFSSDQTGKIAAEQRKREFAYKIMETELGKIDPEQTAERANALLFLTRVGVLEGLNVVALEAIAIPPGTTVTPTIPQTLGLGSAPSYDLPMPTATPGQTDTGNRLHALAVEELNADVDEVAAYERIGKYWAAVGQSLDGRDRDMPWSSAFLSWLVKETGNPDGIELSASGAGLFLSVQKLGLVLPAGSTPLPGDLAFYVRAGGSADQIRSGNGQVPVHAGVVHAVGGETLSLLSGNIGNGIRLSERALNDTSLVGYARLGRKKP